MPRPIFQPSSRRHEHRPPLSCVLGRSATTMDTDRARTTCSKINSGNGRPPLTEKPLSNDRDAILMWPMNWHNSFVRRCARVRHTSACERDGCACAMKEGKRRTTASMLNRLDVTALAQEMRLKCAADSVILRCTSSVRLRSRVSGYPHCCQVSDTPQAPLSSSSGAMSILNIWCACHPFCPGTFASFRTTPSTAG